MMKWYASIVFMILILVPKVSSRHVIRSHPHHGHDRHKLTNVEAIKSPMEGGAVTVRRGAETVQVAGSRLPDCTHACGSCTPCRLVVVSYLCAAETCPIAYKCMCKNKSYPVP